jgi:hypothetical protein
MSCPDPVLDRLATLPVVEPAPELSASLRAAALVRLCPRRVHPVWALVVATSVVSYLAWAVQFSSSLY